MGANAAAAPGAAADGPLRLRALLLLTMALWGINLSAVKALVGQIDVMPLATLRMVLATAVMLPFCWVRLPSLARLSGAQWLRLVACAAVMVYANQALAISGMARTSTTHTALIAALTPLGVGRATSALYWVPIFGIGFAAVFGAQIHAMHLVGLAGVVAGTWLTARWAPRRMPT